MSSVPRRWLELRARSSATADRSALVADALIARGARGVEERAGWYVAYFEEPDDPEAFVAEVARSLEDDTGIDSIRIEFGWQAHEDWADTWKRGLGERRVTDRIVVHPSWVEVSEAREGDIVIVLDPGMAFGTAEHGTTRGCLRLLDGVVEVGDRILDVGAGSGILAIAAARLGASDVLAIEGDPLACEAMRENVDRNGVGDRVQVRQGLATAGTLADEEHVSGIVANIETGLLSPLFEGFADALPEGGWLVVSGILEDEWAGVRDGLEAQGFRFEQLDADGPWRSALLRRTS